MFCNFLDVVVFSFWKCDRIGCFVYGFCILFSYGFHECWKEMTQWADGIPILEECVSCIHKYKCNRCIALHYNDTGVFNKVSPRLCWKRKYPSQAEAIEKQLMEKGLLHSGKTDDFRE